MPRTLPAENSSATLARRGRCHRGGIRLSVESAYAWTIVGNRRGRRRRL